MSFQTKDKSVETVLELPMIEYSPRLMRFASAVAKQAREGYPITILATAFDSACEWEDAIDYASKMGVDVYIKSEHRPRFA